MSPNPIRQTVMNRANLQIDGFDTAKGALDHGQTFVVKHGLFGGGDFGLHRSPNHVDAVQSGFGVNLSLLALKTEAGVLDDDVEVFAHFVMADYFADRHADRILAA